MGAATYIDQHKNVFTCKFSLVEKFGCPKDLLQRLKYTKVRTKEINFKNNKKAGHGGTLDGSSSQCRSECAEHQQQQRPRDIHEHGDHIAAAVSASTNHLRGGGSCAVQSEFVALLTD